MFELGTQRGRRQPEVNVLDAVTGAVVAQLIGHTVAPRCVAFHPDGSRIATGDEYGELRLWDPTTETLITMFEERSEVVAVAWSRDGTRLATVLAGGTLRVREAPGYIGR